MNDDQREDGTSTTFDERLLRAARDLRGDVTPPRDLWPGIEDAITAPARRTAARWPRLAAQAAAVLLLVGGSSALTWLTMRDDVAPTPQAAGHGELAFEPVSGSFGSDYTLGPDFTDARNSVAAKLDAELKRLPPDTRADVEKNIATIRAAIVEINKALADQPDNVLLQELLLSAYNEELAVMSRVDRLANSVMRRDDI